MKLRHISAVAALAVLLPFAVSALTTDDIQAQIQSLLTQISQLQQQLAQLSTTNPTQIACTQEAKVCPDGTTVGRTGPNCEFAACTGGAETQPSICPILNRALAQGATGDDVTKLQQYLGVSPTGFFGTATQAAVQNLQAANGIVSSGDPSTTGWGAVGPATRGWFSRHCGGGGGNQSFTASPTSGAAPLTVSFGTRILQSNTGTYSVDFGDGTNGQMNIIPLGIACVQNAPCYSGAGSVSHTYTSNGTYTAKLMYAALFYCPPGAACPQMMPAPQTVGTATIYVGGTSGNGAPSISGLDGPAALAVGQQGTWTVHATVADNANTNLRYSVIWGDEGIIGQLNAFAGGSSQAIQTSGSFTHAYNNAGTYKPTFTVANDAGSAQTSASVTVGGGNICPVYDQSICPVGYHHGPSTTNANGCSVPGQCIPDGTSSTFSASPTSGAAPLAVAFTIPASAGGGVLNYGDGTSANVGFFACTGVGIAAPCTTVMNHTYTANGTYTAKLSDSLARPCAFTTVDCNVVGVVTITVGTNACPGAGCPDLPPATLTASPTSGQAPLAVSFTASGPAGTNILNNINFGDGQTGALAFNGAVYQTTHTYATAGTYIAVVGYMPPCTSDPVVACTQVVHTMTVTITVGGSTSVADFSASPTSGAAPLNVSFKASNTDGKSAYSVSFGDGASADMMPGPMPMIYCPSEVGCPVWNSYLAAYHTYTAGGTYTATLYKNSCPKGALCIVGSMPAGAVTITVTGNSSGCDATIGCSYTVPPSTYPNATIVGQSSSGQGTQVSSLGRSCVLVGNSYTCNYQTTGGNCSASAGNAWVCAYQPSYSCGVGPVTMSSQYPCSLQDSLSL